jgi:hypothetical protein
MLVDEIKSMLNLPFRDMAIKMVNDSSELVTFTLKHEKPLPPKTMAKIILNNNGYDTYKL